VRVFGVVLLKVFVFAVVLCAGLFMHNLLVYPELVALGSDALEEAALVVSKEHVVPCDCPRPGMFVGPSGEEQEQTCDSHERFEVVVASRRGYLTFDSRTYYDEFFVGQRLQLTVRVQTETYLTRRWIHTEQNQHVSWYKITAITALGVPHGAPFFF